MTFEEAKAQAEANAKNIGKEIIKIQENNDYWLFEAGLPNERFFDDGAGTIYVSKKDGTIIPMQLWLPEIQELNRIFSENAKIIYDYCNEQNIKRAS